VGDEPVTERVLQPGDRIGIGDFAITFYLEVQEGGRHSRGAITLEDDKPTAIRTLLEFEPPRVAAEHLRTLLEFSRRLIAVESPEERLDALCNLMIRRDFHGTLAAVLHVDASGNPTLTSRIYRPGSRASSEQPYISRRVILKLLETGEPV